MADATATSTASAAKVGTGLKLPRVNSRAVVMALYLLFLMLPIYWLLNMSLKTNNEILSSFTLWPRDLTFQNYVTILTDPSWYMGYVNTLIYVVLNTAISSPWRCRRLRLQPLPLHGRQAPVLLAADQPHGAARGVRAALLPAVFQRRAVRHAYRRGPGALPVQRAAGGLDPGRVHARRAQGNRRDRLS